MVTTSVFVAAMGTGTALFIAVTIVVYKYYVQKRKCKEWSSLDQMPFPMPPDKAYKSHFPFTKKDFNIEKELLTGGGSSTSGSAGGAIGSTGSRHSTPNSSAHSLTAELLRAPLDLPPTTGHNASASPPPLQHQSRSYPGGAPLLCRTPSVSSQSSLDSTASKQ
ncbi:unnamed protein product, partial [Callosobruchus maculatus]